jgi:hypothetical protein
MAGHLRTAAALLAILVVPATAVAGVPLPPERPAGLAVPGPQLAAAPPAVPLPAARPDDPPQPSAHRTAANAEHMVCSDPRLIGRQKPVLIGRIPGCAIADPVEISSIAGVVLSKPATLDCRTALTFANWVTGIAEPAAREHLGAPLKQIWLMGSYSCRTRNNQRGARLSEHSVGRAVDVGGFTLGDGREVTVEEHWRNGDHGKFLSRIWNRACGMFKTVLGPDGDRHHRDHLHLDTAYRKTSFCR